MTEVTHLPTRLPTETGKGRVFLFLQGPHGPFFAQLAKRLRHAGATAWRIGFNAGDRAFWPDGSHYMAFRATRAQWPDFLEEALSKHSVTDLVVYGDTRWMHAQAITTARARGLTVHVFEEGYLRPYWVTYERGGSNGHSPLMRMSLEEMRAAHPKGTPTVPPGHWGNMRSHVFYGALYHACVIGLNRGYPAFRPHRSLNARQEFWLYLRRLLLMPLQGLERRLATFRIKHGGFPYHIALLQLEHDASFRAHSSFETQEQVLTQIIAGFAAGAPAHHHLVFKAHPLEDGRVPLRRDIRRLARAQGVGARVRYLRGGKLAGVLQDARSAVTVNSTAGQQALWRGIPLKALGRAVYNQPGLVSDQPLPEFFADPVPPDPATYRTFSRFLLQTSQVPGSYYSGRGRAKLLRQMVDLMVSDQDRYLAHTAASAAQRQQLRVVE
ncbi:capsular biosynthesis protein [uncultured Roseobacter sp.]|uniref:capsule biosynthesis protein n=1 Tax=uncultured Roseobacter sp. TaxID=114847 RepID=UPI00260B901E|nr:capsular biosynthesis protein [uncultured Roseobacter sp.]